MHVNYNLNDPLAAPVKKRSTIGALRDLFSIVPGERRTLCWAFVAIFVNSGLNLVAPYLVGRAIDTCVKNKDYHGVLLTASVLLVLFVIALVVNYLQIRLMGGVGQRMLFGLRNAVYKKLLELPVAFFNQNKAGDLISRVNNDSDKINQFFSQSLMQFVSNLVMMLGAAIFLVVINAWLGLVAIVPALVAMVFAWLLSPWLKRKNARSMQTTGALSAITQENLDNFKLIVAFNRRDYFRQQFDQANHDNYRASVSASVASNILMPVYSLAANGGLFLVLVLGIYFISRGLFSVGLLISFVVYVHHFYNPLRQIASLWGNFQVAMAGWERISTILALQSNIEIHASTHDREDGPLVSFRAVSFAYPGSPDVLHEVSFDLHRGKTYAFVGPTGGGKTTTAFLLSRLYDCTSGIIMLDGQDIRSYAHQQRAQKVGFILQDPFLFGGTLLDNILYGNDSLQTLSRPELMSLVNETGINQLLDRFDAGLDTVVESSGDAMSLGQKQIIAFMRAVLRQPDLLILDEATANIDSVTEKILDDIVRKLPPATCKVIIAHRLNTIENADAIFFVNAGMVVNAGSFSNAVDMLLHDKRQS